VFQLLTELLYCFHSWLAVVKLFTRFVTIVWRSHRSSWQSLRNKTVVCGYLTLFAFRGLLHNGPLSGPVRHPPTHFQRLVQSLTVRPLSRTQRPLHLMLCTDFHIVTQLSQLHVEQSLFQRCSGRRNRHSLAHASCCFRGQGCGSHRAPHARITPREKVVGCKHCNTAHHVAVAACKSCWVVSDTPTPQIHIPLRCASAVDQHQCALAARHCAALPPGTEFQLADAF
jgi:hypothetical protein